MRVWVGNYLYRIDLENLVVVDETVAGNLVVYGMDFIVEGNDEWVKHVERGKRVRFYIDDWGGKAKIVQGLPEGYRCHLKEGYAEFMRTDGEVIIVVWDKERVYSVRVVNHDLLAIYNAGGVLVGWMLPRLFELFTTNMGILEKAEERGVKVLFIEDADDWVWYVSEVEVYYARFTDRKYLIVTSDGAVKYIVVNSEGLREYCGWLSSVDDVLNEGVDPVREVIFSVPLYGASIKIGVRSIVWSHLFDSVTVDMSKPGLGKEVVRINNPDVEIIPVERCGSGSFDMKKLLKVLGRIKKVYSPFFTAEYDVEKNLVRVSSPSGISMKIKVDNTCALRAVFGGRESHSVIVHVEGFDSVLPGNYFARGYVVKIGRGFGVPVYGSMETRGGVFEFWYRGFHFIRGSDMWFIGRGDVWVPVVDSAFEQVLSAIENGSEWVYHGLVKGSVKCEKPGSTGVKCTISTEKKSVKTFITATDRGVKFKGIPYVDGMYNFIVDYRVYKDVLSVESFRKIKRFTVYSRRVKSPFDNISSSFKKIDVDNNAYVVQFDGWKVIAEGDRYDYLYRVVFDDREFAVDAEIIKNFVASGSKKEEVRLFFDLI